VTRTLDAESEQLLRRLAPQVLGLVCRRFRDFAAAEDAVQEALLAAATQWPREGLPAHPGGWLTQVACRRLLDQRRSELARERREARSATEAGLQAEPPDADAEQERDDSLTLLFMCCHPSLSTASAIALTLRAVGGLTTGEIAHAFLVPEATMAQRISRAKQSIRTSGIPFRAPTEGERAERLGSVLHVLYLIFNEGYTSSDGPNLARAELSTEAIRLARMVREQLPGDGEVAGLLALMLLTDARRAARTGAGGELVPLSRQDRSRWDRQLIAEGVALLEEVLPRGGAGPYQLQAAIAAVHDEAPNAGETDWRQILALYTLLAEQSDNPLVLLNQAIAVAMVHGPAAGLERLGQVDGDERVARHHRLDATRAHLLELAGERSAAIAHYRRAAERTTNLAERHYLLAQAARLADTRETPGPA